MAERIPEDGEYFDAIEYFDRELSAAFNSYGQFLRPRIKIVTNRPVNSAEEAESLNPDLRYEPGEHRFYGRIEPKED